MARWLVVQATYKCKDHGDWFDSWKGKLEAVVEESRMKVSLLLHHPLQKCCEWNTGQHSLSLIGTKKHHFSILITFHVANAFRGMQCLLAYWVTEISSRNDTYDWKAVDQRQFHFEMLFRWLAEHSQTRLHLFHFLAEQLVSQLYLMKENMSEVCSYATKKRKIQVWCFMHGATSGFGKHWIATEIFETGGMLSDTIWCFNLWKLGSL